MSQRRIRILGGGAFLAGMATAGVLLLTSASSVSASTTPSTTTLSEAKILSIARENALGMGEASPTNIEHSEGTRAAAVLVSSGEVVPGDGDSILIAEHGHFVGTGVHRPPGAPPPEGSVLTLVVNTATGDVTDLGIQDNYPDLRVLGPVTDDQ